MTNEEYWKKIRQEQLVKLAEDRLNKKLAKAYKQLMDEMEQKMRVLLAEIKSNPNVLQSHIYQYQTYYEMMEQMQTKLTELGNKEIKEFEKEFRHLYTQNWDTLAKMGVEAHTFPVAVSVRPELMEKAINEVWSASGTTWKSSVWNNKGAMMTEFQEKLTEGFTKAVAEGLGVSGIVEAIRPMAMDTGVKGYYSAMRLATTELMHVYNQSSLDLYTEEGTEYVEISTASKSVENYNSGRLSTGKARKYTKMGSYKKGAVCEKCKGYEGVIYRIDQAPVLPAHPWCRCCYIPVVQ